MPHLTLCLQPPLSKPKSSVLLEVFFCWAFEDKNKAATSNNTANNKQGV